MFSCDLKVCFSYFSGMSPSALTFWQRGQLVTYIDLLVLFLRKISPRTPQNAHPCSLVSLALSAARQGLSRLDTISTGNLFIYIYLIYLVSDSPKSFESLSLWKRCCTRCALAALSDLVRSVSCSLICPLPDPGMGFGLAGHAGLAFALACGMGFVPPLFFLGSVCRCAAP